VRGVSTTTLEVTLMSRLDEIHARNRRDALASEHAVLYEPWSQKAVEYRNGREVTSWDLRGIDWDVAQRIANGRARALGATFYVGGGVA
jgi:hypothetical protein